MIENIISRFKHKEEKVELRFGPVSASVDPRVYRDIMRMLPIGDTEFNLSLAKENGIKPLSLREIFGQAGPEVLRNAVLFDTSPGGLGGNHWRILEIDREKDSATLQLCGTFGNHDYDLVPPVHVPLDTSMFTGISIQKLELGGLPASLREATKAVEEVRRQGLDYPESLKYIGETILWSNSKGELVTADKHPVLQEKS
jgi:hypothetical protein